MAFTLTTKKLLIAIAVLDAAAALLYAYGFRALSAGDADLALLNARISSYSAANEKLGSLQSSFDRSDASRAALDTYYVASGGAVDFISSIEALGRKAGVALTVISVDSADVDDQTAGFQEKVVLRLGAEGRWSDVLQFLGLVENLPYGVSVDGASFDKLDPATGADGKLGRADQWKATLSVSALKLK